MANDMFYGASSTLFENARKLREAMTPAELALWESLRANQLRGFRFRAQHPIGYFVADFYCHAARLIVELDGTVHDTVDQQQYDQNRTCMLEEFGLTVIRFRNDEVITSKQAVLERISALLPV